MKTMGRNRAPIEAVTDDVDRLIAGIERALSPTMLQVFLMDDVVDYLQTRSRGFFAGEGGPGVGGKWKPLADYTQRDRRRKGFSPAHPINYRTGELHEYVTQSAGFPVPVADGAGVMFPGRGSGVPDAKFTTAQRGMRPNPRRGMRPIPKRPVVGMVKADAAAITTLLEQHIRFASNNTGLGVLL